METIKEIEWEVLVDKAHEAALDNLQLLARGRFGGFKFHDEKCCFEAYGLAEDEIFDEVGPFKVINGPDFRDFEWGQELVVKKRI